MTWNDSWNDWRLKKMSCEATDRADWTQELPDIAQRLMRDVKRLVLSTKASNFRRPMPERISNSS